MRLVTYNIQYGTGKDGRVDIARIAGEIGLGAAAPDVIALQEVVRHDPRRGIVDQPAEIAALFPDHHWVYGPAIDVATPDGARHQFGNMLLSRTAVLSTRNHPLPKLNLGETLSLQRAALEAVIEGDGRALSIYSVHLAHASEEERRVQAVRLKEILAAAFEESGIWSGQATPGGWAPPGEAPPIPEDAVVMGDFNLTPSSPVYRLLTAGVEALADAWCAAGHAPESGVTCPDENTRIDYAFLSKPLAARLAEVRVDEDAMGSDHQPLHLRLDL